ncbi:MAG: molybdopterin-dependent oxidoreductase [Albidovulum sp.]|nr:molybdopterin-dependent oxidoreductase [Albidovulum sp.]MDE0533911.1 molybdopterin-dependent oxidoreductase [Albidovulum sp.]
MESATSETRLPSVCPLDCPDTCSLEAQLRDGRLVGVRGTRSNSYTDGVICNKVARYYPEFVHGENRIRHPLKRIGERGGREFERISWDEALDLIFKNFSEAISACGSQSVMPLNYAGPHGELAGGSMDRRFFYRLGATLLDRGPLCGAVRGTAYSSLFGISPGMPPEQAAHADLIVLWGNNATVSNLHLVREIKCARDRGAKTVVVDPKRTKIAEQADLHLQIYPGTDVVLAMALAAELERRRALDLDFIGKWAVGFEEYMEAARAYSVEDVVQECRLSQNQFDAFASLYASSRTVASSVGNGIERGRSGGSGLRAAMALQALTGNHGRLGAGVIAKPGFAVPKTPDRLQRPELIPEGTRTFNIVDVAEKLLDDKLAPPVKAIMIYNHNPVCTHPDQRKLIKALQRSDLFIAGCDVAMTDSMLYADVVLPAASHFEYDDVYGAYGHNYVQRAAPVMQPVDESLPNTEIFRRLAARFGFDDPMFRESDAELMDSALDRHDPRLGGIAPSQLPLERAIELKATGGGDAIMCETVFPATPSKKIELFSADLDRRFGCGVPEYRRGRRSMPFILISPSSAKRINATFGGCAASNSAEVLEMNPSDAEDRGFRDGDNVSVWNERGEVALALSVTDAVRRGVLYSPKGTWLKTSETGMTVNSLIPSDIRADLECGACYNETYVNVSARS